MQFKQATSLLEQTLKKLYSGEIEIGDFLLINNFREEFYELNNIMWKFEKEGHSLDKELYIQTIDMRCKEIETVKKVQTDIKDLIHLCQHFKGKTSVSINETVHFHNFTTKKSNVRLKNNFGHQHLHSLSIMAAHIILMILKKRNHRNMYGCDSKFNEFDLPI